MNKEYIDTNIQWWLFTNNYLIPFKKYFESKSEAIEKLESIITESKPWYKEQLEKDIERITSSLNEYTKSFNETTIDEKDEQSVYNMKMLEKKVKKLNGSLCKALERHDKFEDFTKENLESSIKLVQIVDHNKKEIEEIFYPSIDHNNRLLASI